MLVAAPRAVVVVVVVVVAAVVLPLSFNNITYLYKDNLISSALLHALPLRSCLILSSCLGLQMSNVLLFEVPKNMLCVIYVAIPAT